MKHSLLFILLLIPVHIFSAEERQKKRARTDDAIVAATIFKHTGRKTTQKSYVVRDLAYNPITSILAYTLSNGKAYVSGKKTPCYHNKNGLPLAWSPDGTQLALPANTNVKVWTPNTDTLQWLEDHTSAVTALCWKNRLISGSVDSSIKEWDPTTGQCTVTYAGHVGRATSVDATGNDLIVSSGADSFIRVWDPRVSKSIKALKSGNQWYTNSIACHPTEPIIAVGSKSEPLELWDLVRDDYTTLLGNKGGINAVSWSPDGKFLASASTDGVVRIWNPKEEKPYLQKFNQEPYGHSATAVAWSPEGMLAAGSHKKICFYKMIKKK